MRRATLAVLILALFLNGCAYIKDRVTDAGEMLDLGVTASGRAQFSLYVDGFSVLPVGWSNFHGAFAGLANGHPGISSATHRNSGMIVYGTEQIFYDADDCENNDASYLREWKTGVIGFMNGPLPPDKMLFSVPVQLHVAWLGAAFNLKPVELVDFVLGFALVDITGDDSGRWRNTDATEPLPPDTPIEGYEPHP